MPDAQSINFMAMLNPQFATQQQQFALQQAMAQQMMQEGGQQEPTAQLANPGGQVVANSPIAALSHGLEKGLGAYLAKKGIDNQMASYAGLAGQQTPSQSPNGQGGAPLLPWQTNAATGQEQGVAIGNAMAADPNQMTPTELMHDMMARGSGTAEYNMRTAGIKKAAEESAIPRITPQGTYATIPVGRSAAISPPVTAPVVQPIQPSSKIPTETNIMPNPTANTPKQVETPLAGDGKPLFGDNAKIVPPDPTRNPKWPTANTNTDVNQIKLNQESLQKGDQALTAESQSLGQQQAQLNNLIDVYKNMQSGTLTMQNPEFMNKLVALGVVTDPSQIKDIAGAQIATQNHILQVIGQIKDSNANIGGGTATRTFGSEITNLLEKGESSKAQPEALWNVIGQAKGLVDHHLDKIKGWQAIGGRGNRMANGTTMLPDDYSQNFDINHNISDYRDKALKDMGPFKGMAGNTTPTNSVLDPQTIVDELRKRGHKIQ